MEPYNQKKYNWPNKNWIEIPVCLRYWSGSKRSTNVRWILVAMEGMRGKKHNDFWLRVKKKIQTYELIL
jgi:hypothetical protein